MTDGYLPLTFQIRIGYFPRTGVECNVAFAEISFGVAQFVRSHAAYCVAHTSQYTEGLARVYHGSFTSHIEPMSKVLPQTYQLATLDTLNIPFY